MEIKDVAIIYQAGIYDVERLIETLNKIGIRAKKYTDDLEAIKAEVREQVANYNSERTNEKLENLFQQNLLQKTGIFFF